MRDNDKRRPSGYTPPAGWTATRSRILKRDAGRCHICGQDGADTVDHIVPVSQGGSHHDNNLAPAHRHPCHAAKTEHERRHALAARTRHRPARPDPRFPTSTNAAPRRTPGG